MVYSIDRLKWLTESHILHLWIVSTVMSIFVNQHPWQYEIDSQRGSQHVEKYHRAFQLRPNTHHFRWQIDLSGWSAVKWVFSEEKFYMRLSLRLSLSFQDWVSCDQQGLLFPLQYECPVKIPLWPLNTVENDWRPCNGQKTGIVPAFNGLYT